MKCIATLKGHKCFVNALARRSDGVLASGCGFEIKLWRDQTCIATLNHGKCAFSLAWCSDGVLASANCRVIKLWRDQTTYNQGVVRAVRV